ncbi:unnamed protein product [Aureobasidium uvarum]|uniref:Uncharacterized protein n=1 Tax=Aureobasidium uvarum TaxID=2773716 RepID=A0A9N8PV08_9PEZI|nr:unnamed protein product [Aureobasidium uvarum]
MGRGIAEIWQRWIGNALVAAPDLGPGVVAAKISDDTSLSKAIIIDDDDSDDEIRKPKTPTSTRPLPRMFRVPPGASLVTPLSDDKVLVTPTAACNDSKIIAELESDHEQSMTIINRTCPFPSPQSLEKRPTAIASMKPVKMANFVKANKVKSPRHHKCKKVVVDSSSESDKDMAMSPPTIGSTRKRRRGIDYTKVPNVQDFDNSDEDFRPEEDDGDRRIDEVFASKYPVLETPSKRQKKAKL